MEQAPKLDALVVCIGGGGLMSGCSIAAKHLNPAIRIIASNRPMGTIRTVA